MTWKWSLLLVLVLPAVACGREPTTPSADSSAFEIAADKVLYGYSGTMLTADGVRQSALRSDSAYSHGESIRWDLFGVDLQFYSETGALSGTLTSDTGDYDFGAKTFTARGNVVLITNGPNGVRRLETDEMFYDIAGDRLWTDHPFTWKDGGSEMRGDRFLSNSTFSVWEVMGATGTLPTQGGSGAF